MKTPQELSYEQQERDREKYLESLNKKAEKYYSPFPVWKTLLWWISSIITIALLIEFAIFMCNKFGI